MDSAHDIADYFTGATAHGHIWLELVEVDSPDERVAHELAIPVDTDSLGEDSVDWAGARWLRTDSTLGELVRPGVVAQLRRMQSDGTLPCDEQLIDCWAEMGGREARAAWRVDMAI
jgi:hypothetical protein